MKIDFKKIQIKDLHGKMSPYDFSEEIGKVMYGKTTNELELELARKIANQKEIDLSKAEAEVIKRFANEYFLAFAKEALIPALDLVIDAEVKKEKAGEEKVKPIKK
jgi:sulfur relay (sulfurtransferase) DsrC/TusE family protein